MRSEVNSILFSGTGRRRCTVLQESVSSSTASQHAGDKKLWIIFSLPKVLHWSSSQWAPCYVRCLKFRNNGTWLQVCMRMCVHECVCLEPPLKFNKDSEAPWFLAPHTGSTACRQSGQPGPLTKSKRVPIGGGDWQQLCSRLNLVGSLSKRNLKNTIIFS